MPTEKTISIYHTVVAIAVNVLLLSYGVEGAATEYKTIINGSETAYDEIVTVDENGTRIYAFEEGDRLVIANNTGAYGAAIYANSSKSLQLNGPLSISNTVSNSDDEIVYSAGLYVSGTIVAGALNFNIAAEAAEDNENSYLIATGIHTSTGTVRTGDVNGYITACSTTGASTGSLMAIGVETSGNSSTLNIDGNAVLELSATGDAAGVLIAGANVESSKSSPNNFSVTGLLKVSGTSTLLNADSDSEHATAYGLSVSTATTVTIGSLEADLHAVVDEDSQGYAQTVGIYAGTTTTSPSSVDIGEIAMNLTAQASGEAYAYAVQAEDNSDVTLGKGNVAVKASSDSYAAAWGLYASGGGKITKQSGDINVESDDDSWGLYAGDGGAIEYAGGSIFALSKDGLSVGIYAGDNASVDLTGTTLVVADAALSGSGTVTAHENAFFEGTASDFTGTLNILGQTSIGLDEATATASLPQNGSAALAVQAGAVFRGAYIIGSQAAGTSQAGSSLTLLDDAALVLVADSNYEGGSLATADYFDLAEGAEVRLLNSASFADGTIVLDGDLTDGGAVFTTDNLLVSVVDNQISRNSAASVFGGDLLIDGVVDAAAGSGTEAARLIDDLTATDVDLNASKTTLNNLALTAAASGLQTVALNALDLVGDSTLRRAEDYFQGNIGGGLWVEVNGSTMRADSYSADAVKFGMKSDLEGAAFGADAALGDSALLGASISAGKGCVRGQDAGSGIKNDLDYWALNLYGMLSGDWVDFAASAAYLETSNDVTANLLSASPEAKAYEAQIRAQKTFALGAGFTVTPHIGLRWTRVEADAFAAAGFTFASQDADIASVPIGATLAGRFTSGGMIFTPTIDLEATPSFGDKKSDFRVGYVGGNAVDEFEARIAGSTVWSARLGLTGVSDAHVFGVRYGVQASTGDRVDQQLKLNYRYAF